MVRFAGGRWITVRVGSGSEDGNGGGALHIWRAARPKAVVAAGGGLAGVGRAAVVTGAGRAIIGTVSVGGS